MAKAALNLWAVVLRDGQDEKGAAQAKQKIPALQGLIENEESK